MTQKEEEESQEYDLMTELERLESIREDMQELGMKTLSEVEARIVELHQKLDDLDQEL